MPIIHHAYRKEESELGRADAAAAAGAVKHSCFCCLCQANVAK
jgi:hypothetical protein